MLSLLKPRQKDIVIAGATEAPNSPCIGKSLRELGISNSDTKILCSDRLSEAVRDADVYVSFTTPVAELINIPIVANLGKRIILGTTGFNPEQNRQVLEMQCRVKFHQCSLQTTV